MKKIFAMLFVGVALPLCAQVTQVEVVNTNLPVSITSDAVECQSTFDSGLGVGGIAAATVFGLWCIGSAVGSKHEEEMP